MYVKYILTHLFLKHKILASLISAFIKEWKTITFFYHILGSYITIKLYFCIGLTLKNDESHIRNLYPEFPFEFVF